jgi:hypothetical protein
MYKNFEKGETLTSQVVIKYLLKKRREDSSRGQIINIVRGEGNKNRGIIRYKHGYTINLLIKRKKSSSSTFFFIYSSTPLLIVLCLNLRVGHKAELLSVFLVLFYKLFLYDHGVFAATYIVVKFLVMKKIFHK